MLGSTKGLLWVIPKLMLGWQKLMIHLGGWKPRFLKPFDDWEVVSVGVSLINSKEKVIPIVEDLSVLKNKQKWSLLHKVSLWHFGF